MNKVHKPSDSDWYLHRLQNHLDIMRLSLHFFSICRDIFRHYPKIGHNQFLSCLFALTNRTSLITALWCYVPHLDDVALSNNVRINVKVWHPLLKHSPKIQSNSLSVTQLLTYNTIFWSVMPCSYIPPKHMKYLYEAIRQHIPEDKILPSNGSEGLKYLRALFTSFRGEIKLPSIFLTVTCIHIKSWGFVHVADNFNKGVQ
jgi:hypothetical protein